MACCIFTAGCSDDDDCSTDPIATSSLEAEYACSNTLFEFGLDLPVEAGFTIISSQAEYDAQVSGTCQPQVDFDQWDLVVGQQELDRNPAGVSYNYRRACPTKRYEMRVVFALGSEVISPVVTYHLLVPKIGADEAVDIRIEYN